jgi:hypothetical protein
MPIRGVAQGPPVAGGIGAPVAGLLLPLCILDRLGVRFT